MFPFIKKNRLNLIPIFILLIVTPIGFLSCEYRLVKSLCNESSENAEKSKKDGYFVSYFDTASIKINDSIDFKIIEAFAEIPHRLRSYNDYTYIIDSSRIQIVIWFDKDVSEIKGYGTTWDFDCISHVYSAKFLSKFDTSFPGDSIGVKLLTIHIDSTFRAGKNDKIEFGEFFLLKKKNFAPNMGLLTTPGGRNTGVVSKP